jgi:hypothetical protein
MREEKQEEEQEGCSGGILREVTAREEAHWGGHVTWGGASGGETAPP